MKLDLAFTSPPTLRTRSGAYGIICDADDRVLLVRAGDGRFYLPGGGIRPSETPELALMGPPPDPGTREAGKRMREDSKVEVRKIH